MLIHRLPQNLLSMILILIFLGISDHLRATHIIGGDISYRCLGNNQYEITMTVRRDCINGQPPFDDPAYLGVFDSKGIRQINVANNGRLDMLYRADDTLNEVAFKNCGIVGGDVCVHTTTYKDTLELPFLAGGYILAYQRCCRNRTILNIVDPENTGATYTAQITESALLSCNSSPVLSPYPPIYICGNQPIEFHLAAKDAEGDSLVYALCNPNLGATPQKPRDTFPSKPPYDPVLFSQNYTLNDMIGGTPALHIDSKTGIMRGFAVPIIAQYLVAYCVEEYRNGKLLSVLRRDFQINVRLCNSVPEAAFKYSINTCKNPVELQLIDESTDQFSTIDFWQWTVFYNANQLQSNTKNPIFSLPDSGIAKVRLVIHSKESCYDTIFKSIKIQTIKPELIAKNHLICRGDTIELIKSYNPAINYTWSPSIGLSCVTCPNPKASPSQSTKYLVHYEDALCEHTDMIDVNVTNCTLDSCGITIIQKCLPNGMVEVTALNAFKQIIQPKNRNHELFWQITASANHPEYTLINQNPILLFKNDVFSLTSKMYSWKSGLPKTIEFADICKRSVYDTLDIECSGPCEELEFILSSCEDDYDVEHQLVYPDIICQSVCSSSCMFIVGLFETNGQLIDPSQYQIRWSTGSSGAYVMMMGTYFNTLTVEVRKGDCIWRGRYWKSCHQYKKVWNPEGELQLNSGPLENYTPQQLIQQETKASIYDLQGHLVAKSLNQLEHLASGVYFIRTEQQENINIYKFFKQ